MLIYVFTSGMHESSVMTTQDEMATSPTFGTPKTMVRILSVPSNTILPSANDSGNCEAVGKPKACLASSESH